MTRIEELKVIAEKIESLNKDDEFSVHERFSKPDKNLSYLGNAQATEDLFRQRHSQRKNLFIFVIVVSAIILSIYFGLIVFQTFVRFNFCMPNWNFISEKGFTYLTSGIFVYFLGVVVVITRSLWDEKPYESVHKKLLDIKDKKEH